MFMEPYHTTQTAALSGETSSQLAVNSTNTKIRPISDFTCRLIERLSLTLGSTSWCVSVCAQPRMSREHSPVSTAQQ